MIPESAPQKKEKLKVAGSIGATDTYKIVRQFTTKGLSVVEVELSNGRRCNIRTEEMKKNNPTLLLQFYEENNIEF